MERELFYEMFDDCEFYAIGSAPYESDLLSVAQKIMSENEVIGEPDCDGVKANDFYETFVDICVVDMYGETYVLTKDWGDLTLWQVY